MHTHRTWLAGLARVGIARREGDGNRHRADESFHREPLPFCRSRPYTHDSAKSNPLKGSSRVVAFCSGVPQWCVTLTVIEVGFNRVSDS